ncbi:MAG: hypothetical protein AABY22_01340 [Nanoarchaeota archaeon]
MKYRTKIIISILVDLIDFIWIIPLTELFGEAWDVIQGIIALWLWGGTGLSAFWELLDPLNKIDAFIPTLTIIGLLSKPKEPQINQSPASYCRQNYSTPEEIEGCIRRLEA